MNCWNCHHQSSFGTIDFIEHDSKVEMLYQWAKNNFPTYILRIYYCHLKKNRLKYIVVVSWNLLKFQTSFPHLLYKFYLICALITVIIEPGSGTNEGKKALYHCNYCNKDISGKIRIKCTKCPDFDLCVECFSVGAEVTSHKSNHPYRVMVGAFIVR